MSRKELSELTKKKANRTWDTVNLIAAAVGGAILAFAAETPALYQNITIGQITGAVLLATVVFRVAHLIHNEQR